MSALIEIAVRAPLAEFELVVDQRIDDVPLAVFGASGAGKTTLLRSIAGLHRPAEGRISVNSTMLFDSAAGTDLPPEQRAVGYVPQEGLLFPHLSVEENLLYGFRRTRNRPRTVSLEDVVDVLGIGAMLERRVTTLSGGERQRVAIGRALLASPRLLLLDEPLAAIDLRLKRRILPYLIRAVDHFAIPTLYVSHHHEDVTQIARDVMVLDRGRVVACGAYLEIIDNPAVFDVFSREGVINTLSGLLAASSGTAGFTSVRVDGVDFRVPPQRAAAGTAVSLSIRASDIILAMEEPGRISTRNVLPGRVTRIAPVGEILLVHIDVGCDLVVELTPSAVQELGLSVGTPLWALIKTNAITVAAPSTSESG